MHLYCLLCENDYELVNFIHKTLEMRIYKDVSILKYHDGNVVKLKQKTKDKGRKPLRISGFTKMER